MVDAVEQELIRGYVAIEAAEDWSHEYDKQPELRIKIIKVEARMESKLRKWFDNLSKETALIVNWPMYEQALMLKRQKLVNAADDFNIEVIVDDVPVDEYDGTFIKIMFEEIATAAAIGAEFGEKVYSKYLALQSTDTVIQQYARSKAAELVGRKLDKDGNIVDNPKASYRISDKTRADIRESIRTSINLSEDQETATKRLTKVIRNPKRAALIAQTEAVNSFQGGLLVFGKESGAVAKESQALNTGDRCKAYEKEGIVGIDHLYDGKFDGPAYHPRCRCALRLIFPEELELNK